MTRQPTCNTFAAPAESYDRLMGRYLPSLAPAFADAAGIGGGMRLLDVGCGLPRPPRRRNGTKDPKKLG